MITILNWVRYLAWALGDTQERVRVLPFLFAEVVFSPLVVPLTISGLDQLIGLLIGFLEVITMDSAAFVTAFIICATVFLMVAALTLTSLLLKRMEQQGERQKRLDEYAQENERRTLKLAEEAQHAQVKLIEQQAEANRLANERMRRDLHDGIAEHKEVGQLA